MRHGRPRRPRGSIGDVLDRSDRTARRPTLSALLPSPALPGTSVDPRELGADDASLKGFLRGLPGVDRVGLEKRAADLATRSIKQDTKRALIDLAIATMDLTTLEGADTPARVRSLCARARRPDPSDPTVPAVAAVCVYPDLVAPAVEALAGSTVRVASVATAFPSGRASLAVKLADTRDALSAGAEEIDMVIDRGAFLSGRERTVLDEIRAVKDLCGDVHLKVILETGELATYDNVRRASWLALIAGADVIKTSTGKVSPAATHPVALVMLEAVRDFHRMTGEVRGVKVAGGIRTTKDAIRHLVLVNETLGGAWLTPERYRIGASGLLTDLLMQRQKVTSGVYGSADRVTLD